MLKNKQDMVINLVLELLWHDGNQFKRMIRLAQNHLSYFDLNKNKSVAVIPRGPLLFGKT